MPERKDPENIWRSQPEEEPSMPVRMTGDELRALSQAREKLNRWVSAGVIVVTAMLTAALLYNVYRIDQPWIRFGQAWTLCAIVYLFGPAFDHRGRRPGAGETCAQYLARQHQERGVGYRRIRNRLFLLIPGIAAAWWGAGPLAAAKARGLDPSSWPYRFAAGPGPFLLIGSALLMVWLAFGKASEKADREREEVCRLVEGS